MERFDSEIVGEIEGLLKNVDLGDADIYLRLYMIGKSPEASRPVIMVCCSNPRVRTQAENAIRESRVPEEYPEFALGASALPLEQPGLVRALAGMSGATQGAGSEPRFSQGRKRAREGDEDDEPRKRSNPDWSSINLALDVLATPRPVGRRIYVGSRHATGGVCIRVGSRDYQLTVSHVTDDYEPPVPALGNSHQQDLLDECHFDDMSEEDDEVESYTSYESNETPDIAPEPPFHPQQNAYVPRHLAVSEYDSRNGQNPGLDYMLLPLDVIITPDSKQADFLPNAIMLRDGRMVNIRGIATVPAAEEKEVVVATASSGVIHGVLIPTVLYLRNATLPHFQKLYPVHLENPVGFGDSGSAVVDETTGQLFGHLVRGAHQSTTAYMVAATEVFEDLEQNTTLRIRFIRGVGTRPSSHVAGSSGHMVGGSQDIPTDPEETVENLDPDGADSNSASRGLPSLPGPDTRDPNLYSSKSPVSPMGWGSMNDELETPGLTMASNTEANNSAFTSAMNSEVMRRRGRDNVPGQHADATSAVAISPGPGCEDMAGPLFHKRQKSPAGYHSEISNTLDNLPSSQRGAVGDEDSDLESYLSLPDLGYR